MEACLREAERVAKTDATVLLLGETGVGKNQIAHFIHERSPRRERALIHVNAAGIPTELLGGELFGTVQGAATGVGNRAGRIELADKGTFFLDEVGDLAPFHQPKLLHVLQTKEVQRVGSRSTCGTSSPPPAISGRW